MQKQFEYLRPDGKTTVGPVGLRATMKAASARILAGDAPFIIVKDGGHRYPCNTRRRALKQLKGILAQAHVGVHAVVHKYTPAVSSATGPAGHPVGDKVGDVVFSAHRVQVSLYDNPMRDIKGLTAYRQDMGVDYRGSGPIYAPGPGTITAYDNNSSWPGGHKIAMRFTEGAAHGLGWYLTENLKLNPKLHIGSKVDSNTVLATLLAPFPHSEQGWSHPDGSAPLAYGCYKEGQRTAAGDNASKFLEALGAPGGLTEGRPIVCKQNTQGLPRTWKGKV